ncbi:MAG: hypothetical protein QXY54_01120 [Nitrososphaerota archaeon]
MKTVHSALYAVSLILLLLAFLVYQGSFTPPSSIVARVPGVTPVYELRVKVEVVGLDGVTRNDVGALVMVGFTSAYTDSEGVARLQIPVGRYSAYVKSSDLRLIPLTLEIIVESNMTLNTRFEVVKAHPEKMELDSRPGLTSVKMFFTAPEGGRLFISYPQISGVTSNGVPVKMARGVDGVSNFFQRVEPGVVELRLDLEKEIISIDEQSTFVPLQIINWWISA